MKLTCTHEAMLYIQSCLAMNYTLLEDMLIYFKSQDLEIPELKRDALLLTANLKHTVYYCCASTFPHANSKNAVRGYIYSVGVVRVAHV